MFDVVRLLLGVLDEPVKNYRTRVPANFFPVENVESCSVTAKLGCSRIVPTFCNLRIRRRRILCCVAVCFLLCLCLLHRLCLRNLRPTLCACLSLWFLLGLLVAPL